MAKGKASNIADKVKWLLSISIFSLAIVGNGYYTEVAFFLQSSCRRGSFYCCNYYFSNYSFWKECGLINEGIKNRDEKSCLAYKNGDYSNLYGGFWFYYRPMLIFLGARISS